MFKRCSFLHRAAILIAALLVVCCAAAYAGVCLSHGLVVPLDGQNTDPAQPITVDRPDVASVVVVDGVLKITPLGDGLAQIQYGDQLLVLADCRRDGFVYDRLYGRYTGAAWIAGALVAFLSGTAALLLATLYAQVKKSFYHYATPLLIAFLLLDVLLLISVTVMLSPNSMPENILSELPALTLYFTIPIMAVFALAMFISNLSLLRHEGRTWRNLLGSLIGLTLFFFSVVILLNSNVSGSLEQLHFHDFLINLCSGLVLWTECKLAGIILCGALAARGQPAMDRDYILILGCKLSRTGGLTPLLRGRVDRALDFARRQQAATGHMPVLIPCGGKGQDELRSEAEAMKEYLLEQGVPADGILSEDRSANTWENIRNAQAMMAPDAKVAYATTNYHVFRAGVWASRNGLPAKGMGSRTKWYYWPNAFMREYVALISANLFHELAMILIIGIQSGLLAYLYH